MFILIQNIAFYTVNFPTEENKKNWVSEIVQVLKSRLDRCPSFFQVKAVDNGRPQQSNSARLLFTVVASPASSDHAPKFTSRHSNAHVMENDPVGHMVQLLSAEDMDGDKLWYSITGKAPILSVWRLVNLLCQLCIYSTQYVLLKSLTSGVRVRWPWFNSRRFCCNVILHLSVTPFSVKN